MMTIYQATNIRTGYRPFASTDADEAQKYIDTKDLSDRKDWQVQHDTVWNSLDERDRELGLK